MVLAHLEEYRYIMKEINIDLEINMPEFKSSEEIAKMLNEEILTRIIDEELVLVKIKNEDCIFNLYDIKLDKVLCRIYKIDNNYYCPDNCLGDYLLNVYDTTEKRDKLYLK